MLDVDGEPDRRPKCASVYARRVARLLYLQSKCSDDHPVVRSELMLVDMARAKLAEHALATHIDKAALTELVRSSVVEELRLFPEKDEAALLGKVSLITYESIVTEQN